MKQKPLVKWISANALGLGVGFVAMLQITMLIEYGLDFERHWQFGTPVQSDVRAYAARFVAQLLGGVILEVRWAASSVGSLEVKAAMRLASGSF